MEKIDITLTFDELMLLRGAVYQNILFDKELLSGDSAGLLSCLNKELVSLQALYELLSVRH